MRAFVSGQESVMSRGSLAVVAAVAAALVAAPVHSDAQSAAARAIAAELATPAKGFVQPKTAWGEPDLQGVWTSDAALGIPRERPEKFGTRAMLSDAEFAETQKADEKRRKGGENAVSVFRNDDAWKTKSYRQTSLVIEPETGRTPAFTANAQKRAASRDRGSFGEGPFNTPEDFTLYDRCITRGIVGSIMPVVYGNGNRIVQAPGLVVLSYEMVHDTRVIYTDGRPHLTPNIRQYLGDSRGRWDGNTLIEDYRAHHAHRHRRAPLRSARGRSGHLYAAVHDLAPALVASRLRAAAVRVPRGQLHAAALAERRARRGRGD
jgi:hypothetical protein